MGWLPGSADLRRGSEPWELLHMFMVSCRKATQLCHLSWVLSHVWGLSWLPQLCSMSLILQQASLGMIPQQKQKSGYKCQNASSKFSYICCHSLGQNKAYDWTQSQEMGQNSHHHHHPSSQHAQNKEVVQRYTAKGLGPERGKNWAHVSISCSHIRKNLPTLIAGKERE